MGKTILVITGPPSSGKPIIARNIAEWFQSPSLYSKGILEALIPPFDHSPLLTRRFLKSLPDTTTSSSSLINSNHLATTALSIILTQLSYLITTVESSNGCIILELPLSSPPILDTLIQLLLDEDKTYAVNRGVIVECVPKPTTTTTVRGRVEPRTVTFPEILYDDGPNSTSKIWFAVEKAIHQQLQLLLTSSSSGGGGGEEVEKELRRGRVSKLDIDPAIDFNPNLATSSLREGRSSSPFHHAVKYLVFDHDLEKHGPLFFSMREWDKIRSKYIPVGRRTKSAPCFKGAAHHDLFYSGTTTQLDGPGLDDDVKCRLCGEQVSTRAENSPYYSCRNCPLLLHKACAELSSESGTDRRVEVALPHTEAAIRGEDSISYSDREAHFFPTTHTCEYCTLNGDQFSQNCKSCLFDTHLKNRILPIVYHHPFFPDGLFQLMFGIRRLAPFSEPCAACGRRMHTSILYISRGNALWYGVFCLTQLPIELVGKDHYGCLHPLKLLGKAHEEFDYCICHKCEKERDPERWYYYCEECKYTAHTYCMYP